MKHKYRVKVEEVLRREIEVEANSPDEAYEKVEDMYNEGYIVLGDNDLCYQDITVFE